MSSWTVERGALWAIDCDAELPALCQARVPAAYTELCGKDMAELALAMGLATPEPIQQRMQAGRRCFGLRVGSQLAAYGWVTRGSEYVGELERAFNLRDDEAYIWDCGTVPAWRGQRCYSALLSQIVRGLSGEGSRRIWIGASRLNQPSVGGISNAGFAPAVDATYRRLFRLTMMWITPAPSAPHPLIDAAYRIIRGAHELRLGRLLLGYRR